MVNNYLYFILKNKEFNMLLYYLLLLIDFNINLCINIGYIFVKYIYYFSSDKIRVIIDIFN